MPSSVVYGLQKIGIKGKGNGEQNTRQMNQERPQHQELKKYEAMYFSDRITERLN